jgi:7-carboxy-7-deazaguanine synthase
VTHLDGSTKVMRNPIEVDELVDQVASLWEPGMHSVSLTGGEPLLQAEELVLLAAMLGGRGIPNYLETNGTLYEELEDLLPLLYWISMDIKLPSSQGGRDLIEEHLRFFRSARGSNLFLKLVIGTETGERELSSACEILSQEDRRVTLVLQPATSPEGGIGIPPEKAARLHRLASEYFSDVRLIPQMHHLWGIK